jgi:hypothetical protein
MSLHGKSALYHFTSKTTLADLSLLRDHHTIHIDKSCLNHPDLAILHDLPLHVSTLVMPHGIFKSIKQHIPKHVLVCRIQLSLTYYDIYPQNLDTLLKQVATNQKHHERSSLSENRQNEVFFTRLLPKRRLSNDPSESHLPKLETPAPRKTAYSLVPNVLLKLFSFFSDSPASPSTTHRLSEGNQPTKKR